MKSFNIFHNGWVIALTLISFAGDAYALDPIPPVSQYLRDRWTRETGFPGGYVNALAQTSDGYLWIGSDAGLTRFDGLSFSVVRDSDPIGFSVDHVLGLIADADGALWVQLENPTLLHYGDGVFQFISPDLNSEPRITAIARAKGGGVLLASRRHGLLNFSQSTFQTLASATSLPRSPVTSIAEIGEREVWLGTRDRGLLQLRGNPATAVAIGSSNVKVNCLLSGENGELWAGTDNGVLQWNGSELVRPNALAPIAHSQILTMLRDHDSNIWIGTEKQGLVRLNSNGLSYLDPQVGGSNPAVTSVLEDREGNIWAGGANGIDRLRNRAFVTYATSRGETNGAVYADPLGHIWLAPASGGLEILSDGRIKRVEQNGLAKDVVYSMAGTGEELWLGRRHGGLTHLLRANGSVESKTYSRKDGLAQDSVYAVTVTRDGDVWAGTLNAGASLYRGGRFTTYTSADGLAADTVNSIAEGSDGTIWFATPAGLSSLSKGAWRTYDTRSGLPSENVNCLLQDSNAVLWAGTMGGIAFFQSGRISVPVGLPRSLRSQIFGIAEDKSGSLWIAASNRVFRVARDKLRSGSLADGDIREYGVLDGLAGFEGMKRDRFLVADTVSRIWISTNRGVSMIDPARQTRGSASTLVHINGISADGIPLDLKHPRVRSGTRRIVIEFAGLNLSAPNRIRFRFNLDSFDHGWNTPTTGNAAVYTNLNPGSYRFHVTASNPDGAWNGDEASVLLQVDPEFWQTWWFRICIVAFGAIFITFIYRLRLNQLTRQLNIRFSERLTERNRIARDLHDTLLQTIQGSKLVAEDALAEELEGRADPLHTRRALEKLARWLEQAVEESRTALNSLRTSTSESNGLSEAFQREANENMDRTSMNFTVSVKGTAMELHPIAREEIYRIGSEAIRNACSHSGGNRLEVDLCYSRNFLLRVRDNGKGIDAKIAAVGRPTHFGLQGMAERAERAGGKLKILSSPDSGTEVELIVPGHIVFRNPNAPDRWNRLRKLLGR